MRNALQSGIGLVILTLVACRIGTDKDKDVAAIRKAMEPFIYVGDSPVLPDAKVADHGSERVVFPDRLEKGRQYIFHRKRESQESWKVLQNSLRANGAEILDGPKGNVGLVYTTIGGPWYAIEFRVGRLRCALQNRPAAELKSAGLGPDYEPEDYVLTIE